MVGSLSINRRTTSPQSKCPTRGNNINGGHAIAIGSKNSPWLKYLLWGFVVCISFNIYFAISFHNLLDRRQSSTFAAQSAENDRIYGAGLQIAKIESKYTELFQHLFHAPYQFDLSQAEKALRRHGRDVLFQPLRAYVEKPLNDTAPNTVDKGNLNEKEAKIEVGRPAKFYVPLPLREGGPGDLKIFEYGHRLKSCNDLPAKLPVDRGFNNHVTSNVNNRLTFSSGKLNELEEAEEGCPIHADPFLPWVHDLFPNADGTVVHFVAHNKRRCNSGKRHWEDSYKLQPQVTLMQPVSVKRIDEGKARKLAPELWSPIKDNEDRSSGGLRYRLAPHEEADSDAMFTRFICRFRAMDYSVSPPTLVNVGETLSTYPYNYEFVNFRKEPGDLSMLTPKGKDNRMFWLSQLRFDCPVPSNGNLRSIIASGEGVLGDGTPSVYVDVVPIRTAPRYGKRMSYFTPDMAGNPFETDDDKFQWADLMTNNTIRVDDTRILKVDQYHPPRIMKNGFDARLFWGDSHVIPRIEASGRWENFPVCRHPGAGHEMRNDSNKNPLSLPTKGVTKTVVTLNDISYNNNVKKKHKLTACLWASASFTTRGNAQAVSDTTKRLIEWIEFHLLVGFDHIYVYDNTGAHTNETSLESTLFPRFLESEVTRIDWPSRVCNNNIPAHENTGERSSQYAAENSCIARYGPYSEWMATIDTDEYLIPMGKYKNMIKVVDDAKEMGLKILTFRSTRALPIRSFMEPFHDHKDCGNESDPTCLRVKNGYLFAEVYNCDSDKFPKPEWSERAKKQLYQPEYVLTHYVHYATVTKGLMTTKEEAKKMGKSWYMTFHESRSADQITDEINQAVMLHSKTTVPEYTKDWKRRCAVDFKPGHSENCRVGFPWPRNDDKSTVKATSDGFGYNCYQNEKLNEVWLPKLRSAMERRQSTVDGTR
mmetsp:Transcript_10201/g.21894  ORF Transcript_10201/g.21894 Transcript_10201/m.21894 type:complete len:930 (-) Transcript_10201:193-2982(-)